ncbi:MAG: hypothetical protein IKP43_06740 [Bacteroidaceae bacterium]|jgi:negative regulator of sigma E activity|nr:hypothetical protein [Bacteroidaceae bacterium]
MNEEYEIKKRLGNGVNNPFRVPENYFEDFTARMMSRLPADESETSTDDSSTSTPVIEMNNQKRHSKWLSWITAVAAVMVGVVIGLHIVDNNQQGPTATPTPTYASVQSSSEDDYEDIAEYAMIDAGDVYAYLSGF